MPAMERLQSLVDVPDQVSQIMLKDLETLVESGWIVMIKVRHDI